MKRYGIPMMLAGLLAATTIRAQETTIKVGETVIRDDRDTAMKPHVDTVVVGPITVIQRSTPHKDSSGHLWNDRETVRVNWGKTRRKEDLKDVTFDWLGLDLGWNNFTDRSDYGTAEVNDFALPGPGGQEASSDEFALRGGKSVNVNIWPIMVKVNLLYHVLSLKSGFGIEMNNYRYSRPISYVNDISKTYIVPDSISFKKNKLFTEYLTIPLLLHLETNPHRSAGSFRMSIGPTFGVLVKSRTKQVSKERGKVKNNDSFNLEKFRTALRAELGFGPVTLYASRSLTPIHQYGLKQYPYSIGFILINNKGW